MSVECTGRNVEVTPVLEELARKRTQKLERHLGGPARVRIVLSQEKHRFGAEIIASHRRRHWKAQEETEGDPRAAVTLAFEKIEAQSMRDLQKVRDRKHRGAPGESIRTLVPAPDGGKPPAGLSPSGGRRIVRGSQQRMPAKPMSVEEAGLRLETSRQEFLIFRDSGNERISVLYRRRDGDFGLIVPAC
ncbi:MAG TPA: HPF/RaiA family ribosome-associated protein [Thermoanaerobaculia bacterium]|nr:HPF/RaiA family ribosome-associated protein [Thermoanaerobaculia bacterium]